MDEVLRTRPHINLTTVNQTTLETKMNFRSISTASLAGLCLASGLMFTAPLAKADLPDVLAAAPKNTKIFIGTTKLSEMDKQWKQLMVAIEQDAVGQFTPSSMLSQLGISASSLDLSGSLGVAMMDYDMEGDEPPMIMLLPVADYAKWVSNFGPDISADGVAEVTMAMGETAYVRSAGKYAVLSPRKELAEGYVAQDNAVGHFKDRIGEVGAGVIERSQAFAIVDFDGLAQRRQEVIEWFSEAVSQQVAQAGAMGMGMPMGEDIARMNEAFIGMMIDECSGVVAGLHYGERGFALDLAVQTREGSKMRALLPGAGESRNLLKGFEDAPFLMAMSMDYNAVKVGPLLDEIKARLGMQPAAGGAPNMMNNMELLRHTDGVGMAIYPPPGGMFAGLLSRSVTRMTGNQEQILATLRETIGGMGQTEAPGGMKITTEYQQGGKEIAGIQADTYAVKMTAPPEMMQMQQMISMLYGPGGMQGYIVPVEGGVIQTTSRNAEVIEKSIAAMKGEAPSLGDNKTLAAVDKMLPPNPSLRFYIGMGAIAKMAAPLAAGFAPGVDFQELAALPPVGMGATVKSGGFAGSFVVPAPVIKSIMSIAQQAGPMGGNGMDEEEPPLF